MSTRFAVVVVVCVSVASMTGCSLSPTAPASPLPGAAIAGKVHGGQQAVSGAHVYLYAANTAGYNTTAATYGSVSLLTSSVLTNNVGRSGMDGSGNYYVTTDANGNFSIGSDYSCTPDSGNVPGQQVYVYAVGGNPGAGTNGAAGFMAVLGDCPAADNFATATPTVFVNEVSTVAAAYAMAGFAWDATHVSSSSTILAKTGLKNAFANASNLAKLSTGQAYATTPAPNGGNGTVPESEINTLANILASCVNTNGVVTGPTNPTACYTLFYNAENGTTIPSDTATAAINIAHNPGANVAALYGSPTPTSPFAPTLGSQPNDFTIGINFTGGGLDYPTSIAIDGNGDVWVANDTGSGASSNNGSVTEFSSTGAAASWSPYWETFLTQPTGIAIDGSGYVWLTSNYTNCCVAKVSQSGSLVFAYETSTGVDSADAIAIDGTGHAWTANQAAPNGVAGSVSEITSSGSFVSGANGYQGGGLDNSYGIAMDGSGYAWITNPNNNSVTRLSSSGSPISGSSGYTGGGISFPHGIAIDNSGNVWVANYNSGSVSELSNAGTPISGSSGYTVGNFFVPGPIAIDGAGNLWVGNYEGANVAKLSSTGSLLSGTNGYQGGSINWAWGIAVDGAGNVWIANDHSNSVTQLIGAATPVITPICVGLPYAPTSNGTSSLGTRP